jgi:hypothetical protein
MLEIEVDHCHWVAVDLYRNDFVSRWARLFDQTAAQCAINQSESFSCNLTEAQTQERLIASIDAINRFLKRVFIDRPDQINWEDQDWYNYLHVKFEQLSGEFGSPTRLFAIAPETIKEAIRNLNFYVHRLEVRPYGRMPWYISFDKNCYARLPLETKDYDLFQNSIQSGQAFIHYAELGKTTIDLYENNLPTDYAGLKNLHYYSAEILLHLGSDDIELFTDGFRQWAGQNRIDITDKKQGIGIIPIGHVIDVDKARQIVYNGSSITNLRITHHGQTI